MSIVTLTSDFGTKDYFVSSTKAAIINEIKSVNIIDISHQISPFNITEAAYILKNIQGLSYKKISRIIERSTSSIESLIFRAKKNLKKYLEKKLSDKK